MNKTLLAAAFLTFACILVVHAQQTDALQDEELVSLDSREETATSAQVDPSEELYSLGLSF